MNLPNPIQPARLDGGRDMKRLDDVIGRRGALCLWYRREHEDGFTTLQVRVWNSDMRPVAREGLTMRREAFDEARCAENLAHLVLNPNEKALWPT